MAVTTGAEFLVVLGGGSKTHTAIELLRDGKRVAIVAACASRKSNGAVSVITKNFTGEQVTCEICQKV